MIFRAGNRPPLFDSESPSVPFPRAVRGKTFGELFRGVSVWPRIIGGALLGPIWLVGSFLNGLRRGRPDFSTISLDPVTISMGINASSFIGAAFGAALALNTVAQMGPEGDASIRSFLKALFGFGRWSLLMFWIPRTIGTIILMLAVIRP